jgi:hypothetical protein
VWYTFPSSHFKLSIALPNCETAPAVISPLAMRFITCISPLSELDGAVSCAKTGLGSSAALTTSLVSCLLQWFEVRYSCVVPVVFACGLCEQVLCVLYSRCNDGAFACSSGLCEAHVAV